MSTKILDGKALGKRIERELAAEVEQLTPKLGRKPGLAVILVGDDPASKVYVRSKSKKAVRCGLDVYDHAFGADISQEVLEQTIQELNSQEDVDGILLQLPLPKGLDEFSALCKIDPAKDADGLHPLNQGLLIRDADCPKPCTPNGVMALIQEARKELGQDSNLSGLNAVIVGRSILVGKPLIAMLLEQNCTVTTCHSRTKDLKAECQRADILIAAVGRAKLLTEEHVKPGAIVIDVGINRTDSGDLVGDVDFDAASKKAAAITPVPGGVGPMTIAMLLKNTVKAAQKKVS